jgi:hypothetical protein
MKSNKFKKKDDAAKINATIDCVVKNIPTSEIAEKYNIGRSSVTTWSKDGKILKQVAKNTGKAVEELKMLRDLKSRGKKAPEVLVEYIKSNEKLSETFGAVLSCFGEISNAGQVYVLGEILAKMVPGSVKFTIESFEPYLDALRVGTLNLPPEECIKRIPPGFLNDCQFLHEFYMLLENRMIRSFYDNPEKTIAEVKQKAETEEHDFARGVWKKLYEEFKGINEFDLLKNIVDKIPNPDYKDDGKYVDV